MKKFFTILLMLFTVTSMALAQLTKIDKGEIDNSTQIDTMSTCQETRDDLYVEILAVDNPRVPIGYHYPNDSSLLCPFEWGWQYFRTNYNPPFYHHTWETSLDPDEIYVIEGWYQPDSCVNYIMAMMDKSCYIKVTVTDEYGNTGSDSIYFNIKNWVIPPDNFEMEIVNTNGNLNAKLSFTANNDVLFFQKWISQNNTHHDPNYIPDDEGWYFIGGEQLYPGNYTEDIIYNYNYNENTVWNILTQMFDTCINAPYDVLPGMYLCTKDENNGHYLNMKTSLQPENDEYVYTIFTVDSNGIRYPFIVNGGQVILPSSTTNYQIPVAHEHPYYQCAVAKLTDSGEYKILSYSNKVANPWLCTALHIETVEAGDVFDYCLAQGDTRDVVVFGDPDCPTQYWEWESDGETVVQTCGSVLFANPHETRSWDVVYHGCDREVPFRVMFYEPDWEDPFGEPYLWKRQNGAAVLTAVADEVYAGGDMECLWSIGDTTNRIEVTETGLYSVTLSAHGCADTFAVEVRDNVEILNATVELANGKNKVTWQTTPEQAGYIDKVKVILDGSAYSAPYDQGYYQFSGTENTSKNYRLVSVTKEGEECPLASYERGTVHTDYTVDADGLRMVWNVPYVEPGAPDELTGFQICQYSPATNTVTVIEQLDADVTEYRGSADLCAKDRVVVAAVFNPKSSPLGDDGQRPEGLERLSFSNSFTTLVVDEHVAEGFKVYPNPSDGFITVEGKGRLTVTNLLGQEILVQEIEGSTTLGLSPGLYLATMNGTTRKILVE